MRQHVAGLIRQSAIRQFDHDREIPHDVIVELVDTARWTGSARNRQPWRFVEVRDKTSLRALSELGAYACFAAHAPVVLAIAAAQDGFRDTCFDAGRVTQSLIVAAADSGIASCPATIYPDDNIAAARRILGLSAHWLPHHLLALGYPESVHSVGATSAIPRGRLPVDELLTTV